MKYTKEQLEAMSDFEINKLVAAKEGVNFHENYNDDGSGRVFFGSSDCNVSGYFRSLDYCNSWADMGPIISGKPIIVNFKGEAWCTNDRDYFDFYTKCDGNPLRAAAIVYLLMGE